MHQNKAWADNAKSTHPLIKKTRANAQFINAQANLMEEQRLAAKAKQTESIGTQAAKLEETARTQEALGHLGAGKAYGEQS